MDTKEDEIQSNMNIVNTAYLVRDNPELDKQVREALASILSTGEKGISILLDRLYEGVSISGRSIQLKNWGDKTWNEFLIKREIILALQNGYAKSASGRLETLLNADCRVGQWSEIVVPALRSALESLGSPGKAEPSAQGQKDGGSSAQPPVQAEVVPATIEAEVRTLLAQHKKIAAISLVTQHMTWRLSKAKEYVDQLEKQVAPDTTISVQIESNTTKVEQPIQAVESDVIIPLIPSYVKFTKIKDDGVLNGILNIKFPNQCAWCGSEGIAGWRSLQLYEENPKYRSKGQQLFMEGAAMAAGYALGGLVYSVVKPQDAAKIKGIALHLVAPHCVDHATTPTGTTFSLVSSHIRVRSPEYAQLIVQANSTEGQGLLPPNNIVEGLRQSITPKIKLSTYERVRWGIWLAGMTFVLISTILAIVQKSDLAMCIACGWLPAILVGVIWGWETIRKR